MLMFFTYLFPQRFPNYSPCGSQMAPTWFQTWSHSGSNMGPGALLDASWLLLPFRVHLFFAPVGLMEASWTDNKCS